MKVVDETILSIKSAEYAGDYKVKLLFKNGVERLIDFAGFLGKSKNPQIRKYLNTNTFKSFAVDNGDLQWNDYDLCFPLADLYEGKI